MYLLKSCLVTSFSARCCLTVQIRSEEIATRRHNTTRLCVPRPCPSSLVSVVHGQGGGDLACPPGGLAVLSRLVTTLQGRVCPLSKLGCVLVHTSFYIHITGCKSESRGSWRSTVYFSDGNVCLKAHLFLPGPSLGLINDVSSVHVPGISQL